jgi:hypothetical protein
MKAYDTFLHTAITNARPLIRYLREAGLTRCIDWRKNEIGVAHPFRVPAKSAGDQLSVEAVFAGLNSRIQRLQAASN